MPWRVIGKDASAAAVGCSDRVGCRPSTACRSELRRTLGVGDAVVIGLGSMVGAGIFAALGPAARAAGSGLLLGLAVAAVVAYCDAMSSARLQPLCIRLRWDLCVRA